MTYIENIFLCMVSPLLAAALCMGKRQLRLFLFCIAGMGVCLLSAYINTFLAAVCRADTLAANVCYLIQNGADRFSFIFFRGFGTGAMHGPDRGRWACIHMAADMTEDRRHLRASGRGHHPPRDL